MHSDAEQRDLEVGKLVGTRVAGKYQIDRLIGRGGMGAVFQATNVGIGKRVALKFLDSEAARNREAYLRFEREAQAAGMVESAHIVQIFDSGSSDSGLPFLVMELLTGEDLRARLRREKRLPWQLAIKITSQVLRALVRAHAAGIVHRDLKPDNVFLCARDDDSSFVKIVDFGISKLARSRVADTLTRQGTVLGTAYYMSPEQAESIQDIDGRTDLFSVGAMLFEMLVGRPPHVAATYEAVLIAICTRDADDVRLHVPEIPDGIAGIVKKALSRDRDGRFSSAQDFLDALASPEPFAQPLDARSPDDVTLGGRTRSEDPPQRAGRYGTLVAGIIATLSGFALTAYFMSRGHVAASVTPATTSAPITLAPVVSSTPGVPEVTPSPQPAPALAGASASAKTAVGLNHPRPAPGRPSASGVGALAHTPPASTAPGAAFPTATATATAPKATPTPKPTAPVAHGLTLSTREP